MQTKDDIPPWGLNAIPLMVCPYRGMLDSFCNICNHGKDLYHPKRLCCENSGICKNCVQIGWRERKNNGKE
jgi:hypothetical protein